MGKKWYTDGKIQVLAENCPEGFHPGRLPVSEETRKKHSQNNGWQTMTDEQKKRRAKKISETIQGRTEEEKESYAKKVSKGRTGKGTGIEPWNKGSHGLQTAWNKGSHLTEEQRQHLRDIYNALPEEEKERRKQAVSAAHKGKSPWNFGLVCPSDPEKIRAAKQKEIQTKKELGSFQASSLEDFLRDNLLEILGEAEFDQQYFDKDRYPFACDFYIRQLDLFIEVNGNWTHGYRAYNAEDPDCQRQLEYWQKKAETSDYYKNAIYTWTDLDVRKAKAAVNHKLNYVILYTKEDIVNFCQALSEWTLGQL